VPPNAGTGQVYTFGIPLSQIGRRGIPLACHERCGRHVDKSDIEGGWVSRAVHRCSHGIFQHRFALDSWPAIHRRPYLLQGTDRLIRYRRFGVPSSRGPVNGCQSCRVGRNGPNGTGVGLGSEQAAYSPSRAVSRRIGSSSRGRPHDFKAQRLAGRLGHHQKSNRRYGSLSPVCLSDPAWVSQYAGSGTV
jgi:hypothetical protein